MEISGRQSESPCTVFPEQNYSEFICIAWSYIQPMLTQSVHVACETVSSSLLHSIFGGYSLPTPGLPAPDATCRGKLLSMTWLDLPPADKWVKVCSGISWPEVTNWEKRCNWKGKRRAENKLRERTVLMLVNTPPRNVPLSIESCRSFPFVLPLGQWLEPLLL